jgi:hypothetical protein
MHPLMLFFNPPEWIRYLQMWMVRRRPKDYTQHEANEIFEKPQVELWEWYGDLNTMISLS